MRFFLIPALALLSIGFLNAGTANAWTCNGAEYVCGSQSSAKKATYANKAAHKGAKHQRVANKVSKKKSYSTASYGGGSSGMASYTGRAR